jgi:hypothetical protein
MFDPQSQLDSSDILFKLFRPRMVIYLFTSRGAPSILPSRVYFRCRKYTRIFVMMHIYGGLSHL